MDAVWTGERQGDDVVARWKAGRTDRTAYSACRDTIPTPARKGARMRRGVPDPCDRSVATVKLSVDYGRCVVCQLCTEACPTGAMAAVQRLGFRRASARTISYGRTTRPRPTPAAGTQKRAFRRSLHIRHVDAGSCNGCESELQALNNPFYNLHRLGIFFTPSPRFADLLLVTGPVTRPCSSR